MWNANGRGQHRLEAQYFLKEHKIDTILISETHFNSERDFKIPSYTVYHANHLIRSNIEHYPIESLTKDYIQETSILLKSTIKSK